MTPDMTPKGTVTAYRMDPSEDVIVFGDELAEGMWVLCENRTSRQPHGLNEEGQIRAQRFRRVTRLSREPGQVPGAPERTLFVGEWVDGYQEVHNYAVSFAWLVKKSSLPGADEAHDDPSPTT